MHLAFALPYDQNDFEFVGVEPLNMKAMENLTYDRLHTNGVKSLYPHCYVCQYRKAGSIEWFGRIVCPALESET